MTDPTMITPASSSGGNSIPPTSPSRDMTSSPTHPALSASASGSRPNTAPTSPERTQVISVAAQQMGVQQQLPAMQEKAASPVQVQTPQAPPQMDSVVLGLQQLERQQAEQELKRQAQATPHVAPHDSEDDDTAPSSTNNSNTTEVLDPGPNDSTIGRFIHKTRKRLSSRDLKASPNENASMVEPVTYSVYGNVPDVSDAAQVEGNLLISGYLHKFGRNGKWQKRFFETDGENLTYYKTSARTKLLATLDLVKVGDICLDSEDPEGCTLIIQVADRPYRLRADSQSSCRDWVITLNRVKEARLHIGRMQLVKPANSSDSDPSARVVLEANRQRTKAVDDEDIHSWEDIVAAENAHKKQQEIDQAVAAHATRLGTASKRIQEAAVARWQKRQTSVQRLATRLLIWARSVKVGRKSCTDVEDQVVLDHHVHPPGHNDSYDEVKNRSAESSVASQTIPRGPTVISRPARGSHEEDDEKETREIS